MFQINVKSNADKVAMEFLAAAKDMQEKAVVSALNKVVMQARTAASREIRAAGYNMKAADIKKALRIERASTGRLRARLIASGRPIALIKFGARETQKGVSVNVLQGRKVIQGAFIAKMPSGHIGVFVRDETRPRMPRTKKNKWHDLPIRELFGPSIPSGLANAKVQDAMQTKVNEAFPRILAQESRWLASKLSKR